MTQPQSVSAYAETIEATPRLLDSQGSEASKDSQDASSRGAVRNVALVEGSSPHLSAETRGLLRSRLRIVALLLLGGFSVFLLWRLLSYPISSQLAPGVRGTFVAHLGVTALMALCAWKLCAKCDLSMTKLRIAEAIVFGVPALFFAVLNYEKLRYCTTLDVGAHVPTVIGTWVVLIFYYAMFVPNTWQRAAVALSLLGSAPIVVMVAAYFTLPSFAQMCALPQYQGMFTQQILMAALAVIAGVVGVHTIGTLRREAFAAKKLGQYHLKKLLGSGGMGEVYLAEHQMMKRPCAIKVIRPEKAGDANVLARFEREVRATAKLSHWNSIDVFDYGRTEDGTFYYVMEFLPGHNFGDLVKLHGPLPSERIVHLMRQVCEALSEAHGMGLIHRDIKPANLYCAHRGGLFDVAKVLDFGLAKPVTESRDVSLTQEGSITGSPLFMSPEQAAGAADLDARSDVYSLGAVMYYMAAGRAPFAHSQPLKVLIAHATEQPASPRQFNPELSEQLEQVILRAMEKQPEDRFQTVLEMRDALVGIGLDGHWTTESASDWWINHGCPKKKALDAEALQTVGA